MTTALVSFVDRPVAFTGQPACRPENFYLRGGTSMATEKKGTSKKGKIKDLPKSKRELTSEQAKVVKGGIIVIGGRSMPKE
jgi:hypothetical protein